MHLQEDDFVLSRGAKIRTQANGVLLSNETVPVGAIVYRGTFTTAGGDATESITVTGALTTDVVMVSVKTAGGTPRSIVAATAAANAITVTMSGDPSTDHVLQYIVVRVIA